MSKAGKHPRKKNGYLLIRTFLAAAAAAALLVPASAVCAVTARAADSADDDMYTLVDGDSSFPDRSGTSYVSVWDAAQGKYVAYYSGSGAGEFVSKTISKSTSGSGSGTSGDSSDSSNGPGTVQNALSSTDAVNVGSSVNGSNAGTGPTVTDVKMTETYHQDYQIYSESLQDMFFIYANVGNNGMTDKPCYLDIPEGLSYTAKKDGKAFDYVSKQLLSENGTYVFSFVVSDDDSKPVASQKIYRSVFNFRIQPKPPGVTSAASEEGTGSGQADSSWTTKFFYPDGSTRSASEAAGAVQSAAASLAAGEGFTLPTTRPAEETSPAEKSTEESTAESSAASETSAAVQTAESTEAAAESMAAPQEEASGTGPAEYTQAFDQAAGLYKVTLPGSKSFFSGVRNGMLSRYAVSLDLTGLGDLTGVRLLKDGLEKEIAQTVTFNEVGSYELLIPAGGGTVPFSFRLVGDKIGGLDSYTVPEGIEVVSFLKNGMQVDGAKASRRLDFSEDGAYELTLLDPESNTRTEISFAADHTPPAFTVTVAKHAAAISYQSDDIREIVLTDAKGKAEVYTDRINQVNLPGRYVISVRDEAGNVTEKTFTVTKAVNMAGPFAILILLGLSVAGVIFYRRTRENVNVK